MEFQRANYDRAVRIINLFERLKEDKHANGVFELLGEDPYNCENAKLILILKEMSVEVANSEF